MADMAVTVIDDYQGRGLGGLLLDVAVLDAFAFGVERFEGLVLGENISSRRMLARGGATLRPDGGGVLAFTLALRPRVERLRSTPLPTIVATQNRRAPIAGQQAACHGLSSPPMAPGPIALVGSGEFLPAMEAVDAALLAGRPARAVFLPTAAAPEGPGAGRLLARARDRALPPPRRRARPPGGARPARRRRPGHRRAGGRRRPRLPLGREPRLSGRHPAGHGRARGDPGRLAGRRGPGRLLGRRLRPDGPGRSTPGTVHVRPGLAVVPELVVLPHFDQIEGWRPGIVDRSVGRAGARSDPGGIDEETALVSGDAGWRVEGAAPRLDRGPRRHEDAPSGGSHARPAGARPRAEPRTATRKIVTG